MIHAIDVLRRYLSYSIRSLAREPGVTAAIVVTLALGIGASSAVFTTLDAVLFQPLPFPDADRLVRIRQTRERATVANVAPVRLEEWNEQSSSFEAMMGYTAEDISDPSGDFPERIRIAGVSPRMAEVWGIEPIVGRSFTAADHAAGASPVALISESLWRRRFDADPNVVGSIIGSDNQSAEIVGVMPAEFAFPDSDVEAWAANVFQPFLMNRGSAWYTSFGRLQPGVGIAEAEADLRRVQAQLAAEYPDTDRGIGAELVPLKDMTVGGVRPSLWLMFGAVSVLLLIACTNIAALLLARATDRQHGVAIRLALGSSRSSIAGQVLTETAILAVMGAGLGLLIAESAVAGFQALAPNFPRLANISLSTMTLAYVTGVVVAVTLLCGLAPALRNARRTDVRSVVDAGRAQVSKRHSWQWVFVGVQVAMSVALLSGAGLLVRSYQALTRVDTGYNASNVLTFRITGSFAEDFDVRRQRVERMLDELRTLPGVEATATSSPVPGVVNDGSGFQFGASSWDSIEGGADLGSPIVAEQRVVSPSYFEAMQIPLLAGEGCQFNSSNGTQEIVVNESFVRSYLSGRSAVGALIRASNETTLRIRSVVGDAREFGPRHAPLPTAYSCNTVIAYPPLAFLVRTTGDPLAMVGAVRQRLKEIEAVRSIYDVQTLEARIGTEYSADRLRTVLIALFAGAALALVSLGIYGTLSYVVSLRRREVGLRVALGALQQTIVSHFLFKALRVVGVACLCGLILAFLVSRGLASQLFGVSATDPLTLSGVIGLVFLVATIAALVPALRASRVDPMIVLREE